MSERPTTLTLQDIADLANVRRPVVSMWRKRRISVGGVVVPFPEPVTSSDGVEHFRRDDVADYLRRTGRGNNDEFPLDAPSRTVPDAVDLEQLVTLLCLRIALGDDLTVSSEKEQMAAAYTVDPGDAFLVREVLALPDDLAASEYVDELVASSFGAEEALERLEQTRTARRRASRGLTAECAELVAAVADACAARLSSEDATLVCDCADVALASRVAGGFSGVAVIDSDSEGRELRRRLFIRGIQQREPAGPQVRLVPLVGRQNADVLARLDDAVLDLGADEAAVVIGPAAALTDGLAGDHEVRRSEILRSKALACALRLPRGHWRGAHRQALAIWVCVGRIDVGRPMVADLEAFEPGEIDLGDIGADVAASLAATTGEDGVVRAVGLRAYRYLRPHLLSDIHGGRPVVPRGVRAERLGTTASTHRDQVIEQTLLTSAPTPTFDVAVADAPPSIVVRPSSLGEFTDGALRMCRGSRIDLTGGDPRGTVEVWSGDGPTGVRYDPIDAERRYPSARRTEPGDVIFEARPRPRAVVDARGGALVASPARILRLTDVAPLRPHTLAALINLLPAGLGDWQAWPVPHLPPGQADALEAALRGAAAYESELRTRLAAAQRLKQALISGVAAGAITIEHETSTIQDKKEDG